MDFSNINQSRMYLSTLIREAQVPQATEEKKVKLEQFEQKFLDRYNALNPEEKAACLKGVFKDTFDAGASPYGPMLVAFLEKAKITPPEGWLVAGSAISIQAAQSEARKKKPINEQLESAAEQVLQTGDKIAEEKGAELPPPAMKEDMALHEAIDATKDLKPKDMAQINQDPDYRAESQAMLKKLLSTKMSEARNLSLQRMLTDPNMPIEELVIKALMLLAQDSDEKMRDKFREFSEYESPLSKFDKQLQVKEKEYIKNNPAATPEQMQKEFSKDYEKREQLKANSGDEDKNNRMNLNAQIQVLMQERTEMYNLLTNIIKQFHEMSMTAIRNIRG